MKKIIYPLALGAILAAPLVFLPGSSKANNPWDNQNNPGNNGDWYRARDVNGNEGWYQRDRFARRPMPGSIPGMPGVPGNSVPLNEGQIFLIIAGLGLGAKVLYDRRKYVQKTVS